MMYISSLALFLLAAAPGLASITCLHPSATATAQWTNADNQRCTWTGTVGSNFGTNAVTGGECVIYIPVRPKHLDLADLHSGIAAMAGNEAASSRRRRCHSDSTIFQMWCRMHRSSVRECLVNLPSISFGLCEFAKAASSSTQDCFSHDICSWFNNASGGARYGESLFDS